MSVEKKPFNFGIASATNGQVLTVDHTRPNDVKWSAGKPNWDLIGSAALTGAATITISGISGKDQLMIVVASGSSANAQAQFTIRFNGDSTTKYNEFGQVSVWGSTYSASNYGTRNVIGGTEATIAVMSLSATSQISSAMTVQGCNGSGYKVWNLIGAANGGGSNQQYTYNLQGFYTGTSPVSSVSVISNSGNFDNGTLYVYGSDV